MSKKIILFVNGIADNKRMHINSVGKKGEFNFSHKGHYPLLPYLDTKEFTPVSIFLNTDMGQEVSIPEFDAVVNQISDPYMYQIALSKIANIHSNFKDKLPFLNLHINITTCAKEKLSTLLSDIEKLHVPKIHLFHPLSPQDVYDTAKKENLSQPFIIQAVTDPTIKPLLIIDTSEIFDSLALDGQAYTLTSFKDYLQNGFYRKERLVVIDGNVFLADVQFSDVWNLNEQTRLHNEETEIMQQSVVRRFDGEIKPLITESIKQIHQKVGLDFFILDCHIDHQSGHIQLITFNPECNIFAIKQTDPFVPQIVQAHKKLNEYIASFLPATDAENK